MRRTLLLVLVVTALMPASATGQSRNEATRLLARGDSAYARRDTATARASYEALLRLDADQSRAVYQLGRLQTAGSAAALRYFRRYTELEPQDAWGFLALGEAHEDAGDADAARAAYAAALVLEPTSPEIRTAWARVAARDTPSRRGLAIEPVARFSSDSDRNETLRTGFTAIVTVADSVTIGAALSRLQVDDGFTRAAGVEGTVSAEWRPRRALLLQTRGGLVRVGREDGTEGGTQAVGQARLRWRPERGPMLEVRARREPLTATPQLLATGVAITEARGTVELPLVSGLRARGTSRYGSLRAPAEVNERVSWGAGPVLRLGRATELNASYARTTYARPSTVGYFAPRRIDALDAGVYMEHYGWWPITLVLDAGAGVERITRHEERGHIQGRSVGAAGWQRALRLWSQASWSFTERSELRLELEASDTQVGEVVSSGSGSWQWGSLSLSALWRP